LFVISQNIQANGSDSILSVKELELMQIKAEASENAITNLKIESETWTETKSVLSDPCESWQQTPIYHSHSAWYQKGPNAKTRVDVHNETFEWKNGPSEFGAHSFTVSFDGKQVKEVRNSVGPFGETHPVKRGTILAEMPNRLKNGNFDTGAYYSLPFFNDEIYKFSKMFQLARDPNSKVASELEFRREEFQGTQCIKISSEKYPIIYWLDLEHDLALRGKKTIAKYKDGREELVSFTQVTKLKKVADDLWWPMEIITILRPYADGKPYRRLTYRASNVVVNDTNFDESIFTVSFPEGYLIDDKVAGKKYRVKKGQSK
jgi:hypothetical protein